MQNINFEKISVYLVAIGTIYMFWQSQLAERDQLMLIKDQIAEVQERIAKLEVKVEHLQNDE